MESNGKVFKCDKCSYQSTYHHNLLRHKRQKHRVVELASDYEEALPPPPPGPPPTPPPSEPGATPPASEADEEEEGGYFDDIESMVDHRLNQFLEGNNIKISQKGRTTAIKSFMNSSGATLMAGMCIGYLLTANAPMIMAMVRRSLGNGLAPVGAGVQPQTPPPPPTPAQMEMMRQALAASKTAHWSQVQAQSAEPVASSSTSIQESTLSL
jgi:hypothetical protein